MDIKELLEDAYKEDMTDEYIKNALASKVMKLKNSLSKSNTEAADYKKQLREKMTADEIKAKEDAEKQEKLQNDYDALLKKVSISENKARLLSLGYDDILAGEAAEAMVIGDINKVIESQKKYAEAFEKKIRSDILKETPKPVGGNGSNNTDYAKQIEEAQKNGDISAVAYYTRLQAQESSNIR